MEKRKRKIKTEGKEGEIRIFINERKENTIQEKEIKEIQPVEEDKKPKAETEKLATSKKEEFMKLIEAKYDKKVIEEVEFPRKTKIGGRGSSLPNPVFGSARV
jgi:hypothetical protein